MNSKKYLLNRLNREDFEKEIEKRHRTHKRNSSIANCLRLYLSVMTEHFHAFIRERDYRKFFEEEERIRKFTNENLQKVCDKLNISPTRFLLTDFSVQN